VKDVAAEKGVQYVFDSSPGKGLIVFEKGEDLMSAVKVKLGM
ncbi:MAG: OmpH family outer membrane protein, partial [Flavobacteriaceae bacterium]|nr:OmpH family outer membrane protein [Flavobacteriaceae bacterium]